MLKRLLALTGIICIAACSAGTPVDQAKAVINDIYAQSSKGNAKQVFNYMINIPKADGKLQSGDQLYADLLYASKEQPDLLENLKNSLRKDAKDAKIQFEEAIESTDVSVKIPVKVSKDGEVKEQVFSMIKTDDGWKIDIQASSYLLENQSE